MKQTPELNNSRTLKLLIVDDDQSVLDMIREGLASSEFEILEAHNADEAFQLIQLHASRLALIISDFNMPGANGFELRKMMLPELIEVPFVILSGFVTTELALQALDLKISQFLAKPFRIQMLRDCLAKESDLRVKSLREDEELRTGFIEESRALLNEMEELALGYDRGALNLEAIHRLFACAHTIKGTSGYFYPNTTAQFTHKFEDFITRFRKEDVAIDAAAAGVILAAIDITRELMRDLENFAPAQDIAPLVEIFEEKPVVASAAAAVTQGATARSDAKADEIKVSTVLLDSFMERSGELTVLRNMVNKALRLVEMKYGADSNVATLNELLNEMHKTNVHMQDQISDLRKVPFRHIVKPLSRTVRDLASQLKKKIVFEIEGEDMRIDHAVADVLNKCLIHIIRNSADHGLEGPEERSLAGKDPSGLIVVTAEQANDFYSIRIVDDGRGINLERVTKKIIENGLVSSAELAAMKPEQIFEFIFAPGFSTAVAVTDVSGRGVGTDMVKRSVEAVGGKISVQSESGRGSTFTLSIPVPKSALIVSSLLVQAGAQILAIPQSVVRRVLRVDEARIQYVKECAYIVEDEELIPLLALTQILGIAGSSPRERLVLVETKAGALALQVDSIFDVEDTVVKPVAKWFKGLTVYSGATFLADGRVGLVLDVDGLVPSATPRSEKVRVAASATQAEAAKIPAVTSVLLFNTGTRTNFAAERNELYRLEVFRADEFQTIGGQDAVLYRDGVLRIRTLDGQLFKKCQKHEYSVIVVKTEHGLCGFSVNSFGGFCDVSLSERPNDQEIVSIEGRAITFVRIAELASRFLQSA